MSNERLGIFEELQARAERYRRYVDRDRARLIAVGPAANGARATTVNPFTARLRKPGPALFHRNTPVGKRRMVWPESRLGLNVVTVVQAVAIESGIPIADLVGPHRHRKLAWPRHVAWWAIDRYCPHYSLTQIGYMFKRDHTSIMHGIQATNMRLAGEKHPDTRALVANVRQRLHTAAYGHE